MPSRNSDRTILVDHRRTRQFTENGPWLFWRGREAQAGVEREGLVVTLAACTAPNCDCRDISLEARVVSDNLVQIDNVGQSQLALKYRGTPRSDGTDRVDATVNIETGHVDPQGAAWNPEIGAWLQSEIDGEVLARLHALWRRAKGLPKEPTPNPQPILSAEPGQLIVWQEVHATDRRDVYILPEGTFEVLDAHCVSPGCKCTEAAILILAGDEFVGSVMYDYGALRAGEKELISITPKALASVLEAFRRRHPLRTYLQRRSDRLKEIAAGVLGPPGSIQAPTSRSPRVGRNELCPCGSGKKYKRCCLKRS